MKEASTNKQTNKGEDQRIVIAEYLIDCQGYTWEDFINIRPEDLMTDRDWQRFNRWMN